MKNRPLFPNGYKKNNKNNNPKNIYEFQLENIIRDIDNKDDYVEDDIMENTEVEIYLINSDNYKVKPITYEQYIHLSGWYDSNEAKSFLKRLKKRLIKEPKKYKNIQYKISIERGRITMMGINLSSKKLAQEIVNKLISSKGNNYLNWIEPYI